MTPIPVTKNSYKNVIANPSPSYSLFPPSAGHAQDINIEKLLKNTIGQ
ncbi:13111_t:CDS:2 [Ambispora leptoticha]|uniref:13111_t:CDS:1 n=1 Tax=Ambispora leptoticha TaxID=144679 RepID=A0A9N9ALG1_9GLOM|nr:13111_t:CDS:2 [Ambispora leptoticha]